MPSKAHLSLGPALIVVDYWCELLRDEEGSYLVLFAFLMPVLIGIAGLGTEGGLWLYTQQALQGAADSAAVGAA